MMTKLTYRIENAPGRIYGKNSNELVFKEPASNAVIYSTATDSGLLKNTKKQLFRGPAKEKEGGICIATIDEPSTGTLQFHPSRGAEAGKDDTDDANIATGETIKLKLKSASWLKLASNNRMVVFKDAQYTWTGTSKITDKDGKIVAQINTPWFWQGKLGDMDIDMPDGDEGREVLEMVLATYVQRWWEEKVKEEERAKEAKQQKAKEKKAAAAAAKLQKQDKKQKEQEDEIEKKEEGEEGEEQQTSNL